MLPSITRILQTTSIVALALATLLQPATATAQAQCTLPDVVWLGEGAGTYTLPDGYDTLIVKQFNPFRFGVVDGTTVTLTDADNWTSHAARVWAMTGNAAPPAHFGEKVRLGIIAADMVVSTVIIDDDADTRLTSVVNETESVLTVLQPAMVQPVTFTTTHTGEYFVDSADSIAFWSPCVQPAQPTTPTATTTPTMTPTVTPTPMTPSVTLAMTPTPPATLTATSTPFVLTPPVSLTLTSTPTPTPTPSVPTGLTPVAHPTLRPDLDTAAHWLFVPYVSNAALFAHVGDGPTVP